MSSLHTQERSATALRSAENPSQSALDSIVRYLRMVDSITRSNHPPVDGYAYASIAEYLLTKGRGFTSQPLSDVEERLVKRWMGKESYPPRQCWWNARLLARRSRGGLVYVEGYASTERLGLPLEHAWCELDGKVVDPTWKVYGTFDEPAAYFGVSFPDIAARIRSPRQGPVIDDWKGGFPVLREP